MSTPTFPPFRVLLSNDRIQRRIRELVAELTAALGGEPPCLVAIVEGARPLARHLQRLLPGALPVYEIGASSYRGTASTGEVVVRGGDDIPCAGRDVVLIEDIVDTGRTIARLRDYFRARGARSCRVVTLLDKPDRRVVEVELEHIGFRIPDEFVLGFGMDLDGRYRELPDVVIYEPEVERAHAHAAALE
jgi:hypoxanthine phosphoribosyltransferase